MVDLQIHCEEHQPHAIHSCDQFTVQGRQGQVYGPESDTGVRVLSRVEALKQMTAICRYRSCIP